MGPASDLNSHLAEVSLIVSAVVALWCALALDAMCEAFDL